MDDCLVSFGSNQGDSQSIFDQAKNRIKDIRGVANFASSSPMITKQVGGPDDQNDFLNGCFRFCCELTVEDLFGELIEIESALGRTRGQRWASRKIDLDLLLFGKQCIDQQNPRIQIPHPRMSFRRFVLQPAVEIASEVWLPGNEMTIAQLLDQIETAPNHIVLAKSTDQRFGDEADVIRSSCEKSNWNFSEYRFEEAIDRKEEFKLLVYFEFDDLGFVERASQFPGPSLRLPDRQSANIAFEIEAAIQAMDRL